MQEIVGKEAFGNPGMEPRWTHSNKAGIGTAYSASSHLWFTIWNGIVTEVYYPTIDRPQLRDLQFLVTDGKTFFHEEKRDLTIRMERISDHALGYRCINADPDGRYTITKEVIGDPRLPCLLQRTQIASKDSAFLAGVKIFALCAPHLEIGGAGKLLRSTADGKVYDTIPRSPSATWLRAARESGLKSGSRIVRYASCAPGRYFACKGPHPSRSTGQLTTGNRCKIPNRLDMCLKLIMSI